MKLPVSIDIQILNTANPQIHKTNQGFLMKLIHLKLALSYILILFSCTTYAQSKLPACEGSDVKTWNSCQGSYKYDDGKYTGEFHRGAPNGKGEITMVNGNKYSGDFKNGCFEGIGTMTYANGDIYEGQFAKCKKEGPGKGRMANGTSMDFVFKEDKQISATPAQAPRPKSVLPQDPNAALDIANWKSNDDSNLLDMVVLLNERNYSQRVSKDQEGNIVIGSSNEVIRVEVINFSLNFFNSGLNIRLPNIYSIMENRVNPDFVATITKQDDSQKKFNITNSLIERHLLKLLKEKNIKATKLDIQFKESTSPNSTAIVILPRFLVSIQNQSVTQQLKSLLGEDPAFDRKLQMLVQLKNAFAGQELGILPVKIVMDESVRLKEQKIAKQKLENAIAASFKEKIEAATENKTELAAAISPEIKNTGNNVCLVEKPVESLTLLGIIETDEFIKWSGLKSAEGVSQRLKIFKSANELIDAANNGKCLFIVDYAENMKTYLAVFDKDKKSLKYGVAYTRDESLPLLAKARKYDSREDMEAALFFGPDGASPTQYSEFKQLGVITVEEYKKAVSRMNSMKYDSETNPTSELMLVFLNDEKEGKKSKITALAVKQARDKKAEAEAAAQKKREAAQAEADRKMAQGKCDYNIPNEIYHYIFKNNSAPVPFSLMPITLHSLARKNSGFEVDEPLQKAEKLTLLKAGMGIHDGRKLPACVETMKLHMVNRSAAKKEAECYQIAYLADPEFKVYRGVEAFECNQADTKIPAWQKANQVQHLK